MVLSIKNVYDLGKDKHIIEDMEFKGLICF